MISLTHHRDCIAEATAASTQNQASPLSQPFSNLHPAPRNNLANPFQLLVAGPSFYCDVFCIFILI